MSGSSNTAESPFRSARLLYRAVEPEQDEALYMQIQGDPVAFRNSNIEVNKPQSKALAKEFMNYIESALLGVVICLPSPDGQSAPTPIGSISLAPVRRGWERHRVTLLGVDILAAYRGKGFGSEAISWAVDWAFDTAGMHRVDIRAFEFNPGAIRLYERMGFKKEGVSRQLVWHAGRWWDEIQFGVLDEEWREMRNKGR